MNIFKLIVGKGENKNNRATIFFVLFTKVLTF